MNLEEMRRLFLSRGRNDDSHDLLIRRKRERSNYSKLRSRFIRFVRSAVGRNWQPDKDSLFATIEFIRLIYRLERALPTNQTTL